MSKLCTIVFPQSLDGRPVKTQGTRVFLADGSELEGVSRIVLTAGLNDVWRAQLDLTVNVKGLVAGVEYEVTDLSDSVRRYELGKPNVDEDLKKWVEGYKKPKRTIHQAIASVKGLAKKQMDRPTDADAVRDRFKAKP